MEALTAIKNPVSAFSLPSTINPSMESLNTIIKPVSPLASTLTSIALPSTGSAPVCLIKPQFTKPEFPNDENLPVRLILCFDGTGDTFQGSFSAVDGHTVGTQDSIGTIWSLTKPGPVVDKDGKRFFQHVQYFEGVGTVGVSPDAGLLTRGAALFDAATGHGYIDILRSGYQLCCQKLQPQDGVEHQIFIFGFSRGAFISRALASFLQNVGILKKEFLETDTIFEAKFKQLLGRYSVLTSTPRASIVPPLPGLNLPSMPGVNLPPMPAVNLPSMPGVSLPSMPAANLPSVSANLPSVNLPSVNLPSVNLPSVNLPSVNLPSVNLPSVNLPPVNLPSMNLPSVNLPSVDLPSVNLPSIPLLGKETEPAEIPGPDGLLPSCLPSPRVRLIGAFDTVKTVIPLPISNYLASGVANLDFKMDAPKIVDHFRHALALNEARPLFNPDLWKSDADSTDSSYLEAWFFGYHHDIGGGDTVQGLALWPLQWILHAATDYGLVLDPKKEPYDILFSGKDNVIETPHGIAMRMCDMIKHHTATKLWGLRLNEPFSLMTPQPRQYFQYTTTPPYIKFVRPKVFLHPSAYLVFDVSSSFRIQLSQWKHFRTFLQDRFKTIPHVDNPWWERQAIDSILNRSSGLERLNVMVVGRPNTGKAEMVERIFGKTRKSTLKKHGISEAIKIPENKRVTIRYSDGFGGDNIAAMRKLLEEQAANKDPDSQVHVIWYFVECTQKEFSAGENEFFKMKFGNIPILVVFQNEDKLKESIQKKQVEQVAKGESSAGGEGEADQLGDEDELDGAGDADPAAAASARANKLLQLKVLNIFNSAVDQLKKQLSDLPVEKYVHARNSNETPRNLLNETAICLDDEAIHITQIKAQRLEIKPKIALATEESVRAYTIWHLYKRHNEEHTFHPHKKFPKKPLSILLPEAVLENFNMGFSGDVELIKSRISKPWSALNSHTSGLIDTELPGALILMCMIDAIIVMTYALGHREKWGYGGFFGAKPDNESRSVTKDELAKACDWFTRGGADSKQNQLHNKLRELLDDEGEPSDHHSTTNLQMKIIETVELFSENAQTAPNIVTGLFMGIAASLFGVFSGILAKVLSWWRGG